jgi:hypothetical protein
MAAISSILENAIAADTVEAKQRAHELLEQLNADQIAAVLQLLEVMVAPWAPHASTSGETPREASAWKRWLPISASPWIKSAATKANENRVKRSGFRDNTKGRYGSASATTASCVPAGGPLH